MGPPRKPGAQRRTSGKDHGPRRPAFPGVQRLIIPIIRRPRGKRNILARASTGIDSANIAQPLPSFEIERPPLTLRVRSKPSTAIRSFLPGDSQPAHIRNHRVDELSPAAQRIQILISQNKCSPAFRRTLRRNPERPRMPDVKKPRRRRREPSTIWSRMELMWQTSIND